MKKEQYELTQAQQEWVLQNTGLVYYIVNRYNNYSWQREDLEQIGMLGLCKAAITFDESKGSKFSTYASRCIDNEILMYLRKNKRRKNIFSTYEICKIAFGQVKTILCLSWGLFIDLTNDEYIRFLS